MIGFAILALALFAGAAMAGDYHKGGNLVCADCHNMHYSLTHDFAGGVPGNGLGSTGPNHYLLRAEPNELCLQCHDGQTDHPDVLGANTGTHVREAGALNGDASKLYATASPYETWKGHTLGSAATAPGGTFNNPDGLECINCHDQHGQTNGTDGAGNPVTNAYRNLRDMGTVSISYAIGTNNLTKDVFERDATIGQVPTHYSISNVDFNEPSSTGSQFASWCKGCHTNFHGASGGAQVGGISGGDDLTSENNAWKRHPQADVDIGAHVGNSSMAQYKSHPVDHRVKVMSETGDWTDTGTDFTPSCFSCHKAHGNQNAFGLVEMEGAGTVTEQGTENGTESAKTACKQCHLQG